MTTCKRTAHLAHRLILTHCDVLFYVVLVLVLSGSVETQLG